MEKFTSYLQSFYGVPTEDLQKLLDLFVPKTLKKGEYYAIEGEYSKKLAFVQTGVMRAFYRNPKGDEFNKLFFTPPAVVAGYSSLITKDKNVINIQALSDCELFEAPFDQITALYNSVPSIERLNRIIAEDFFVKKERREMSLVMLDAQQRYELFQKEFPGLEFDIPQYQVASYLGITPTQLSRIRAKK